MEAKPIFAYDDWDGPYDVLSNMHAIGPSPFVKLGTKTIVGVKDGYEPPQNGAGGTTQLDYEGVCRLYTNEYLRWKETQ